MNNLARLLILMLVFALFGCGKKVWPEPDASREQFKLSIIHHEIQDDCLTLDILVSGNHSNLGRITLELEASDQPCPACPFLVSESVSFDPHSRAVTRRENELTITLCGLDPDMYYRARIRAGNVYSMIRDAVTGVVVLSK